MPRIVRAEAFLVDLVPKVKRTDAIQSFKSQETIFVTLTDAEGATGTGYSYTIGDGGPAVLSLLQRTLLPELMGREAEMIERIWRDLLFCSHATAVGPIMSLALAAIDTALWDLRGKRAGLPLHLLAGGAKNRVPMYSTEGGWLHLEPSALVEDALAMREAGFKGSKIKIGKPTVAGDAARLSAVRAALGDDYEIMTDANQSMTQPEASRRLSLLESLNIAWFEEPIAADDIAGHARLNRQSRVPIAVGESMYSPGQFGDYIAAEACGIVQADVARIGGITPWLKVAHLAEAHNLMICPHFLMELHVSLVCAVPNAPWLEYIPQLDDIAAPMRRDGGFALAPEEPGLGIDWDHQALTERTAEGSHFIVTEAAK
ncbi:mandelate racemase/muconate lactonizing enzyme family protein [Paracoccus sp. CPCC 101403]|uniref:Mandelate racemase/muconate lactonizing enzyme family protein n=2 Tax=Paracoccus broussonetiae TaxID=3075834 RepID=A0ABU3E9U4_9RHOB|nr:mandelate racemase/muconate lactonizing enzyme family protein [Paracoccus sp. CPCC 101403]MDT1060998.1 mandelate racemase/muconate lactonizing enzyme family protein [Paracoccus sp. CPCC 101403]